MLATTDVSFDAFRDNWLGDVKAGTPSTVELGHRFCQKLVTQWLDTDEASMDLVYCDGTGDGGIDIAFLDRGDEQGDGESEVQGHTWYLIQSKYGRAFQGTDTLLHEGQKVIDTLDGKRPKLSSLAEGLLTRVLNFRSQASEHDRIVLVFATEEPLNEAQKRVLTDLRAMGRGRIGTTFDVEAISIETVYLRLREEEAQEVGRRLTVPMKASFTRSGEDLLVGSVSLVDLYEFLKCYRNLTEDLDRLYEKNVRRFLGGRGKVNRGMQATLRDTPERFGLYNNGITIVVSNFELTRDGLVVLVEPYVVNGCQTTKTIWEVFHQRLDAGGTGTNPEMEEWRRRATSGVVVAKVVKVGSSGEALLQAITRYTNSQNAVREKDFLALTGDFRMWQQQLAGTWSLYLEIQRGGWDSQKALQKQTPQTKQFAESANAADLIKVYGSGWLGEAGTAFGKNPPFLPNGSIFKKIVNQEGPVEGEPFGATDLYSAYLLQQAANGYGFGRGAEKATRRQTRFLFYMVAVELLKDVMSRSNLPVHHRDISRALIKIHETANGGAIEALCDQALEVVDSYFTQGTEDCVFDEPEFVNRFNSDLNAFLKWEQLGKNEQSCPRFRSLLAINKAVMGKAFGGHPSARQMIVRAISD